MERDLVAYHPLNLAVRFLLEVAALVSMGLWGWRSGDGWSRFLFAAAIPLVAAALWGTFAVPDDPSRSGSAPVPIAGPVRILLEAAVFGVGGWMLHQAGFERLGWAFAALVLVHYLVSYERVLWLLGRRG